MKKFIINLITIYFLVNPFSAYCEDKIEVINSKGIGSAFIVDQKIAEARQKALDMAVSSAFRQALFSIVPDRVFSTNFEKIMEIIKSENSSVAEEFQVAGETTKNNEYIIAVRARFDKKNIEKHLRDYNLFLGDLKLPEIMLLISQKNIEDFRYHKWWNTSENIEFSAIEKALDKELSGMNFKVIQPFKNEKSLNSDIEGDVIPDKKEAINIALEKNADIVVVGKAAALPGGNSIGGLETVRVDVFFVVFRTDTGEKIFDIEKQAMITVEKNIENTLAAFNKAGEIAGRDIGKFLLNYWEKMQNEPNEIELEISGVNYLPRFIKFKNILKSEKIVEDLKEKEIFVSGSRVVVLFNGSSEELAKYLVEIPFQNFGIEITEVSKGKIKINFVD
ncbi:MAG: hypothetical protein CSB21_03790 [Deltaproteobacteria bacterium]|nr:MAG: hypothetical protein CSB21_03790 [Deltaproteobacteria bacterium]